MHRPIFSNQKSQIFFRTGKYGRLFTKFHHALLRFLHCSENSVSRFKSFFSRSFCAFTHIRFSKDRNRKILLTISLAFVFFTLPIRTNYSSRQRQTPIVAEMKEKKEYVFFWFYNPLIQNECVSSAFLNKLNRVYSTRIHVDLNELLNGMNQFV